ncbi:MAG: flagellar basal-body rod protein FlgF [Steroidobacteraceae bacterium]|nr:flagellar basal-body rod protein FlgF [Steroidobacteraceae bacterium]MDW8258549.1 flagellar basal-body rod protein FlgF [Gammaproteobacteria bacterium]
MDRSLYVSMSGAKETLRAQAATSHNLANVATTGFRADLTAFVSHALRGPGFESRVYATTTSLGWKADSGALVATGRDLDVAINGAGWFAVQDRNGNEAYTRAGDLRLTADGQLQNGAGYTLLGEDGPITIPPHASLFIAADGAISIVPLGQTAETVSTVARLKLVNPEPARLERGADGLFRLRDGDTAPADATVRVAGGSLESSNVNAAAALVEMIELARRFELQLKAVRTTEENARAAAALLRLG